MLDQLMGAQAPPGPGGPPSAGGDPRGALLALLSQGAGGDPSTPPPDAGGGAPADPLEATQQVIQDLHTLISVLPDAQHTAVASQCLAALAKVQRDLMGAQQGAGDAQQALTRQLGGQ